jgi:hypothetical protein
MLLLLGSAFAQDEAPDPVSVGIGLGLYPSSPVSINAASARLRLSRGFELEPEIRGYYRVETPLDDETDQRVRVGDLSAGVSARFTAAKRGPVALQVLAAAWAEDAWLLLGEDWDGSETHAVGVSASYGLGLQYYIHKRWSVSADAFNTLVSLSHTTVSTADRVDASEEFQGGLGWDPSIRAMGHVWF